MAEHTFYVKPNGEVAFLHGDSAASFVSALGRPLRTHRASHVEPGPDNNWYADLSPVGGPLLGPFPFDRRADALAAEAEWLDANYLPRTKDASEQVEMPPMRLH